MLPSYRLPGSVLLILAGVGVACGGESLVGPDTGTLEVTSSTVGVEVDADGYTIEVDGGAGQPLAPNATLRHTEVAAGPHTVLLSGIAANCTLGGDNPRSFTVTPGQGDVEVKAPSLPRQAPPGHYQLFILNRNGVPSAGKIIKVQ